MNVVAYMRLFDEGTDRLLERMGVFDATVSQKRVTVVANRISIAHRKEMFPGEPWDLWTGFATLTPRYVTLVHRLISVGSVRALCHIRGVVFCMERRAAGNLHEDTLAGCRTFLVSGMKDPFEVSR